MATDNTGMAPDKATPQPRQYATPNGVFDNVPAIDYPNTPGFTPAEHVPVGGVILADGDIVYNANRRTARLKVRNTGDRPVQVGSHLHFFEANRYLEFDREAAYGCHLNIPATTAVRFEPGEEKEVEVVTFAGKRRVIGFNDLVDGYTGLEDTPTYYPERIRAFARMKELGFKNVSADDADAMYNQSEVDNTKKPS